MGPISNIIIFLAPILYSLCTQNKYTTIDKISTFSYVCCLWTGVVYILYLGVVSWPHAQHMKVWDVCLFSIFLCDKILICKKKKFVVFFIAFI